MPGVGEKICSAVLLLGIIAPVVVSYARSFQRARSPLRPGNYSSGQGGALDQPLGRADLPSQLSSRPQKVSRSKTIAGGTVPPYTRSGGGRPGEGRGRAPRCGGGGLEAHLNGSWRVPSTDKQVRPGVEWPLIAHLGLVGPCSLRRNLTPVWDAGCDRKTGDGVNLLTETLGKRHIGIRQGLTSSRPPRSFQVRPNNDKTPLEKAFRARLKAKGVRVWWGMLTEMLSYELGKARVSVLKHYRWAPWDIGFVDDLGCDMIVMNIGIHYEPVEDKAGRMTLVEGIYGRAIESKPKKYRADVERMLEWAVNWTSARQGRLAIWRETLPQHFTFSDTGIFVGSKFKFGMNASNKAPVKCGPLKKRLRNGGEYNAEFYEVYRRMRVEGAPPGWLHTEDKPSSVEQFWRQYNWTTELAEEERRRQGRNRVKKAKIGVLPLWDMLADIPDIHPHNGDCSHWCYAPGVWDAIIERLGLVIKSEAVP
eukprot:Hpha_TRINITY_DN10561_c0_g1::TRINITY_DN10561_c0_g1_i1::g.31367::m.31367